MTTQKLTPAERIAILDNASTHRRTPVGDGDLVWRIWGNGEPLVLLHGGTGSWMHWVRNIEYLARDYMLLVPDIPGSGESAAPKLPTNVETVAEVLLVGIDQILGPSQNFSIVAFSMGGFISGYVAKLAGARVTSLILVGPAGTTARRDPMTLTSWRRLPTAAEQRAAHRRNLELLMFYDRSKVDELAVHIQEHNAGHSRVRGKHINHTGDLSKSLPGFQGRLASIWGEHDATAKPYFEERREKLEQFRPGATFDIVPGVGHWVQYEAADQFNALLRSRLKPQ